MGNLISKYYIITKNAESRLCNQFFFRLTGDNVVNPRQLKYFKQKNTLPFFVKKKWLRWRSLL